MGVIPSFERQNVHDFHIRCQTQCSHASWWGSPYRTLEAVRIGLISKTTTRPLKKSGTRSIPVRMRKKIRFYMCGRILSRYLILWIGCSSSRCLAILAMIMRRESRWASCRSWSISQSHLYLNSFRNLRDTDIELVDIRARRRWLCFPKHGG